MIWLLIFFPITIGVEIFAPERHLLLFVASSLAILPFARWMGDATEHLAAHFGEGIGGLLNATFGNAAELIIALAGALACTTSSRRRLPARLSATSCYVLGAAMLAGGIRYQEQHFNAVAARSQATMLLLAAIALILPACYQAAANGTGDLERLSVAISIVLLLAYLASLAFALITHRALFVGSHQPDEQKGQPSKGRAMAVLAGATVASPG